MILFDTESLKIKLHFEILTEVGKMIKKVDAIPKLNGSFRFVDDYRYDNMIYGYFVYSKIHKGKIKEIIYPQEYQIRDFTIVTAKDIPGKNIVPEPVSDQPFMTENTIEHFGQIILAVAHPDKNILKDFIKKIKIIYQEDTDALTDWKETLDNEDNVFGKEIRINNRNNIENKANLHKTVGVYYTPHQEQLYLEPQSMIAIYIPKDNIVFIRGSMQCPYFVKAAVENIMGDKIIEAVIATSEGIGGAFGGKEDYPNIVAGIASLLSYKSRKPVKIILDREDDILITTKRHPSKTIITSYTDRETKEIKSIDIDFRLDAGAYQTLSPVVLSRGILHAIGGYSVKDAFLKARLFKSNTPPNGAFRGFGAPQSLYAIESHIDNIANELNINPADLRLKNIFRLNDEFPTGQKITEEHLLECLNRVLGKSDYYKKYKDFAEYNKTHKLKKGIGLSIVYHGGGYTGNGEKRLNSEVKLTIDSNAQITVFVSNVDMGQGAYTTLPQIVAENLNHPYEKTRMEVPNTSKTPNSGPTVASRTIYIVGGILKRLSKKIKEEMGNVEEYVKKHQKEFPKEYREKFQADPIQQFDDNTYKGMAYRDYSWAASVLEIEYDETTFTIKPIKIWAVLDIGKPINYEIAVGQVQGGIAQGLGYALTEFVYKKDFGRVMGLTDYTVPTTMDVPRMDIEFIHTDSNLAKGLGEIPMNFPAPALRNAFYNATGIRIDEIPLTPEKIFKVYYDKLRG